MRFQFISKSTFSFFFTCLQVSGSVSPFIIIFGFYYEYPVTKSEDVVVFIAAENLLTIFTSNIQLHVSDQSPQFSIP